MTSIPEALRRNLRQYGMVIALVSIVTHDRLDAEIVDEDDQLAAADEMLEGEDTAPR